MNYMHKSPDGKMLSTYYVDRTNVVAKSGIKYVGVFPGQKAPH
jgi:hypothetical protein